MKPDVRHFEIPITVQQPRELPQNLKLDAAFVPRTEGDTPADVMAMGGLGFQGSLPALAAERSAAHEGGRGILYVAGPNYHKVGNAPRAVFTDRLQRFGAKHVNGVYDWALEKGLIDEDATSLFESQQAMAGAEGVLTDPDKMRGPLMFLRAMGGVALKHRVTLIGGLVASAPEVMFDKATGPTTAHATKQFLADFARYQGKMSGYVIKSDIWPDLLKIHELQPDRFVQVIVGSNDHLLPAKKQYAAAAAAQGPDSDVLTRNFYEVTGGHVSLASKPGAVQAVQVAQHARSGGHTLPQYTPQS